MASVIHQSKSGFNHTTLEEKGLVGVKAMFDLPEVIASLLGNSIKPTQSDYCQLEEDKCPFCGHKGCFKIFHSDPDNQQYHCFSCEEHGDIFQFLVSQELAENAYEAANKLLNGEIEEASFITEPRPRKAKPEPTALTPEQYQRRQSLLVEAREYYFEEMIGGDAQPLKQLAMKRKIRFDTLIDHRVGYSKGELWRYLIEVGFEIQELYDSGLVHGGKFKPRDFFPNGVYIFPHYDESGDICRFTFKDPLKERQYQLPKQYWLNDIQFYGQDSITRDGSVAIVEGEHDLLALYENGWQGPILATNGSIGQSQRDWIVQHLHNRDVITFFDSDNAGEHYRTLFQELGLDSLIQVILPEGKGKDIDDYLRLEDSQSIEELIEQYGVVTKKAPIVSSPVINQNVAIEELANQSQDVDEQCQSSIFTEFDENSLNDVGNADRFNVLFDDKVVYVPELNCTYIFEGGKWVPSNGRELILARKVGEAIITQANWMIEESFRTKNQSMQEEAGHLLRFGRQALNRKKLTDMLEIFKSANQVPANKFDSEAMVMGINGGVIDLYTGMFFSSEPDMYISRSSDLNYDCDAHCPRWLQFIDEITCGDVEYSKFLQRMVGYILTGRTDEQVLFFLHGHGCNGKSTFMNIIQRLMGGYYHQISSDVLLQTNNSGKGPNPSLAKLIGSRLVVANELPEGSRMDENLVKSMTGNDVIVARQLYAKLELEYTPMFKLIMVGNHKPVIRDTSPGMWRRMILLPFDASFNQQQMDPRLLEKLYDELPGILNWALEGVRMWLKDGIKASIPDAIKSGITEYRHESDLLAMFLDECTSEGDFVYTDELYDVFRKWAERDGDWKMTRNIMTKRLVEKGYEKGRHRSKAMIKGVKLKSLYEDCSEPNREIGLGLKHAASDLSKFSE